MFAGETRTVKLRFREWHDLGPNDVARVRVNDLQVQGAEFTGRTGPGDPALVEQTFPITALVQNGGTFGIRFTLAASPDPGPRHGWFLDDVEVVLER
jgi:hypothetical protein